MRQVIVTLQDGIEPEEINGIMDSLMGVRGVYSVTELAKPIKLPEPALDRCPNTPWLFGDADTLQPTARIQPGG